MKAEFHDPDMPFHWVGADGQHHWVTEDHALEVLKWFYDEWPGGLNEATSAKRTAADGEVK
jgi:hypothetical protein